MALVSTCLLKYKQVCIMSYAIITVDQVNQQNSEDRLQWLHCKLGSLL